MDERTPQVETRTGQPPLGFGLERMGAAALAAPLAAALLLLFSALVSAFGIPQLRFDDNLQNVFNSGDPQDAAYRALARRFAVTEGEFLLLVQARSFAEPQALETLRKIHFEAQLVEGAGVVTSVFSLREPPAGNAPPAPILGPDLAAEAIEAALARIDRHPFNLGKLMAADRTHALLSVRPTREAASLDGQKRLIAELRSAIADVVEGTGVQVTASGIPMLRIEIVRRLIADSILLNTLGAIIAAVIGLAVFRSIRLTAITLLPPLLSAATVLGAMGLLGIGVNAMTVVIPVLILVMVFADSMHLTYAWLRQRAAGANPREASAASIASVGPACVLASATTMIAFAAIAISPTEVVREFGLTGAAGTFLSLCVLLIAHPILCLMLGRNVRLDGAPRGIGALFATIAVRVERLVARRPRAIVAAGVALFVLFGIAHYHLPPDYTVREHLPASDPANAALERIDRHLAGAYAVQFSVPLPGSGALDAATLEAIRTVHLAVKEARPGAPVLSAWSLAEWLGAATAEDAARRIGPLWEDIGPAQRRRLVAEDGAAASVTTWVTEMRAVELDRTAGAIEAAIAARGPALHATGLAVHSARKSMIILDELKTSLLVAVVLAIGLIAAAFRSASVGLISLMPNILPILATGTYLYATGRGLQYASALALTVAFGIAVNDTIHFLNRYVQERGGIDTRAGAISASILGVGPVLIATTMVLCAGLAGTLASGLPMTHLFGILSVILLLTALLADLMLVPSLILTVPRRWTPSL